MGKEISKILPGLYLGRLDNAQNDNDMMANCITHILSVHEPVKQKLQKFKSYEYFEVNVKDEKTACISKYFCKTNDFIHEARIKKGNVLIHCLAGVSRAPTIVLAYLMTVYELTFQDAFSCLKFLRPNINPIANFVKQLNDFEINEVSHERDRLNSVFGIYQNLQDDKKLIEEYINQYENQQSGDYYIGRSIDSNENFSINDEIESSNVSRDLDDQLNLMNTDNIDRFLHNIKSHHHVSITPDQQSDIEEEADIPGSIPIGKNSENDINNMGNSSTDFRGRAHSRGQAGLTKSSILNKYGQTAPATVSLFLQNSD